MTTRETYTIPGAQVVEKVKALVREGNVTRIRFKRKDKTLLDVPLTLGVTVAAAGVIAAIAAFAATVTESTIEVEREDSTGADGETRKGSTEYLEDLGKRVESAVKAEMRHWAGASENDGWEEIGHKLAARIRAKMQEEKKTKEA